MRNFANQSNNNNNMQQHQQQYQQQQQQQQSPFNLSNIFVNGLDIDSSGQYCVTSFTDGTIKYFDCIEGTLKKQIHCAKYGVSCITFTHHSKALLEASPKDYGIRYHSIHDNAYIRLFEGHNNQITKISMCRINDSFMTSSLDKTVRLWDLKSPQCVGIIKCEARPNCAFDNEGMVFAIGTGDNKLKLYDARAYQNVNSLFCFFFHCAISHCFFDCAISHCFNDFFCFICVFIY